MPQKPWPPLVNRRPAEVDGDIVPVVEVREDRRVRGRVGGAEVVHGLVGEHHPPAEGVVRAVALVHFDPGRRQRLAQQDGRVEPRRAAAHADDSSHIGGCPPWATRIAPVRRMLYCQLLQMSIISIGRDTASHLRGGS